MRIQSGGSAALTRGVPFGIRSRSAAARWLAYCSWLAAGLSALGVVGLVLQEWPRQRAAMETDFGIFYAAGRLALLGHLSQAYNVHALDHMERLIGGHSLNLPFPYPPYVSVLLSPFASLTPGQAFALWSAFNVVAFLAAVAIPLRYAPPTEKSLRVLLTVGCLPLAIALAQGENSGLVALGFSLLLHSLNNSRFTCPGIVLLACKPQFLVLPFLLLLLRGNWKQMTQASLTLLSLFLLGLVAGGVQAYLAFAKLLLKGVTWTHQYNWGPAHDYTLKAQMQGVLGHGTWLTLTWICLSVTIVTLILGWYYKYRRAQPDLWLAISAGGILCSTHIMFHDLAVLYPALVLCVGSRVQSYAIVLLVSPWLDPTIYRWTHIHAVTIACLTVVVGVLMRRGGYEGAARRMNGQGNGRGDPRNGDCSCCLDGLLLRGQRRNRSR